MMVVVVVMVVVVAVEVVGVVSRAVETNPMLHGSRTGRTDLCRCLSEREREREREKKKREKERATPRENHTTQRQKPPPPTMRNEGPSLQVTSASPWSPYVCAAAIVAL